MWIVPALRAAAALIAGVVIAFTPAHSASFGLVAFGVFALVAGGILLAGCFGERADRRSRSLMLVQGAVTALAGLAALVLPGGGVHYFVFVVSAWGIVAGALEVVNGIRARARLGVARDWIIGGALTLMLAVAFLVVPPDYRQHLGGIEHIKGELTASVMLVGLFGAWAIVSGMLFAISAVSARGTRTPPPSPSERSAERPAPRDTAVTS